MATIQNVHSFPAPVAGPTPAPPSSTSPLSGSAPDRVQCRPASGVDALATFARTGLDAIGRGGEELAKGLVRDAATGEAGAASSAGGAGSIVRSVAKGAGALGFMLDGAEIGSAYHADGNAIGPKTIVAAAGAVGSYAGGALGAAAGAATTAGVGTVAGGVIGGVALGTAAEAAAKRVLGVKE